MASLTRTVAASGADHTTIASAMSYIVSNFNGGSGYSGTDVATIQLIGAEEYNESNVTLGGIAGTPSSTSYLKLEAIDSAKHDGTYNTSKARVRGNTNAQHVFSISDNYVHVKNLAINQDSTGGSDECIRFNSGVTNVLIEKSVLKLDNNIADQDCIHASAYACGPNYIFDCVFDLGGTASRAAINAQGYAATSYSQTWHIEHCTVDCKLADDNGGGFECGISAWAQAVSVTMNMYVNNCAVFNQGNTTECYSVYVSAATLGTVNWYGSGNISSDNTAELRFGPINTYNNVVMRTAGDSGYQHIVENLTAGSENYQLKYGIKGTNIAINNAVSGGTRDSRVDLTKDVAGNPRPSLYTDRDIGAFQRQVSVDNSSVASKYAQNSWTITGTGFGVD